MKPLRIVSSIALFLAVTAMLQAQDAQGRRNRQNRRMPGTTGMVEKVDMSAKAITVKTGRRNDPEAKSVTIMVNDKTKFNLRNAENPRQPKEAKFADVTTGKRVVIVHEKKDGKEVASQVTIMDGQARRRRPGG